MSVFDDIHMLDIMEVLNFYNIPIDKTNKILCPFHNDLRPSMKIYDDHGYCFSCGKRADVADIIGAIKRISSYESAKMIAGDFGLIKNPLSPKATKVESIRLYKMKTNFYKAYKQLWAYYCLLLHWQKEYKPTNPNLEPNFRWVYAVHHINQVDYKLDLYTSCNSEEEKINLLKEDIESGYLRRINDILKLNELERSQL